jgi:hypothetical protein
MAKWLPRWRSFLLKLGLHEGNVREMTALEIQMRARQCMLSRKELRELDEELRERGILKEPANA